MDKRHLFSRALLFVAMVLLLGVVQARANVFSDFNEKEQRQHQNAIHFMDNGMVDTGIDMLKDLDKAHPSNWVVVHEIVYGYIVKQDYEEAYQWAKKLLKLKDAGADSYVIAGNAFYHVGKRKEAIKIYEKGLKKFPNSARLWVEKGNKAYMMKNYDESVGCYEHAIDIDPNFDASYYRLANLYALSTDPVWAVMYAQNYQLQASKYDRLMEMGKLIYDLYRENVTRKDGKWEVTFTKTVNLSAYASQDCDIPYNGYFYHLHKVVLDEGGFAGDTLTLADVARLHRKYVEIADTTAHDYYNVPVLDMERAALHEGYLDGYIMWMLRGADAGFGNKYFGTEQCDSVVDAFVEWYNNDYNKRGYRMGETRPKTTVTALVPVPRFDDLKDEKACKVHRDEIRAIAKWVLDAKPDTASLLQKKMSGAMFAWILNTDEVSLVLDMNPLQIQKHILPYFMAATIEHLRGQNKRKLDCADFVKVMMKVVYYARKYKDLLGLTEEELKVINQDDETLNALFKADFEKVSKERNMNILTSEDLVSPQQSSEK